MAHPKLSAAVNRWLVAASAAALIAGPMAGAGLAQTQETVDGLKNLTCEEAKKTEDEKLILEFCEEEASESPLSKSVDEVTKTTDDEVEKAVNEATKTANDTVKQVEKTVAPPKEDEGEKDGGGGEGGGGDAGGVLPGGNPTGGDGGDDGGDGNGGGGPGATKVENTGGQFDAVDENAGGGNTGGSEQQRNPAASSASNRNVPEGFSFNADGPFLPGMQSQSSLTLQPFAGPLVSAPPVYELPQIAQELFGTTSAAPTAEDPMVAGAPGAQTGATTATAASPYSAVGGFSATTADPTGWLAATATGLIMLVGAAHALNGGRTPRRERA